MIAVIKNGVTENQIENLIAWLEMQKVQVHISKGEYNTVLGLVGDTSRVDMELLQNLEIVESVMRISEPFKNANRKFHPENTVVDISGV